MVQCEGIVSLAMPCYTKVQFLARLDEVQEELLYYPLALELAAAVALGKC